MKAEHINPFVTATVNVFETMLGQSLKRGPLKIKNQFEPEHEISGVIGFSGKAVGTVVLSLSRSVALGAAGTLLDESPEQINAEVTDVVGELTNMVAGHAKSNFPQFEMSISLPTVISGDRHQVVFPSQVNPICVPFSCVWGELNVEACLVEQAAYV